MSDDTDSVSVWLDRLRAGDPAAAQPLWGRYFARLVGLARGKLAARFRRAVDEEDVALSAFDSFCRGAAAGRFPRLSDRDDLWALLVAITERKARAAAQRELAQKRGGGAVRGDSVFASPDDPGRPGPDHLAGMEPTPAFAAEVAEECERLLALLDSTEPLLRQIAVWKMEGFTNEEIGAKVGRSRATVERKLVLIRALWGQEKPT